MRRLWFALYFAVLGWDAVMPHIESVSPRLAMMSFALAAMLLIQRTEVRPWFDRNTYVGLAIVNCAIAMLLPWPENLGFILLASGCLLAALPVVGSAARGNLWHVPAVLGMWLAFMAAIAHSYPFLEAATHDLDWLAGPIAQAYRLLGVPAAADPPFVHFQGTGVLHTFDCSMEKFVGAPLALFVLTGLATLVFMQSRRLGWKRPAALVVMAFAFAFARLMVLGLTLDDNPQATNFYLRSWEFGILALFAVLLFNLLPPRDHAPAAATPLRLLSRRWSPTTPTPPRRWTASLSLSILLGAAVAGSLGFFDPGRVKSGRVLIDETHSNWEWSTIDLNTESYGVQTVYNYSELVRYLRHYYDVEANFEALTDSLLATIDVLILKTPTRPYEDAEVAAVLRFIERGGGLWMVGDHTNVFGMSTNLNKIARHFGMRYRFDAVVDLITYGRQYFERPRLFSHPSIRHMPPILMATSSSMVGPVLGQPVMVGRSLLSDELDYSTNSFFGDFTAQPSEPFGAMLQAVAVTHGKGRVIGFSDSTIFSNFFMFIRGKPEMALGSVSWLMHENRWAWVRPLLAILAVASALGVLALGAGLPRAAVLAALACGALSFSLTARGLDGWVAGWSALPSPDPPLPIVAFERGRTAYQVPDIREWPERSPTSFHTFYVWTQRVGFVPQTRLYEKCFEGSEAVVLINPRGHFHAEDLEMMQAFVRDGGNVLVLDSPHARHSSANVILAPFGMEFVYTESESVTVSDVFGDSLATLYHIAPVTGGEPVYLLPDGTSALSVAHVGLGSVVAMCGSDNFSDAVLGTTSEVPDAPKLALYRLEFYIFEKLLARKPGRAPNTPR